MELTYCKTKLIFYLILTIVINNNSLNVNSIVKIKFQKGHFTASFGIYK